MEQEIWLPIKYGNGKKEISNYGNVRNATTKRLLKFHISRSGYYGICFWVNKRNRNYKIHRLVAEHFIPNPENKSTVNHKDLDKLNNHVDNLEWNTHLENVQHFHKNGFRGKINNDDVLFIRQNIEKLGCNKIADMLGIGCNYVLGIANGTEKANIHKGFIRPKKPSLPYKVEKYTKNGILIDTYNSIGEAAKNNNAKLSYIQRVLSGDHKSYKGFIYKCDGYKQSPKRDNLGKLLQLREKYKAKYTPKPRVFKKITMLDTDGNEIRSFDSVMEAAKFVNSNTDTFRKAIKNSPNNFTKGYIWKYA